MMYKPFHRSTSTKSTTISREADDYVRSASDKGYADCGVQPTYINRREIDRGVHKGKQSDA